MKCQLLVSREKVIKVAGHVLHYVSELKAAGSPPMGVPGKRIAKCVRSEIDRKWKEKIDKIIAPKETELQKKADKRIKVEMKPLFTRRDQVLARIDASLKLEEGTHDAPWELRALAAREARAYDYRGGGYYHAKLEEYWRIRRLKEQKRRQDVMGRKKSELAEMIREDGEKIRAKYRRWVAEHLAPLRQRLMDQSGPHEWRLTFALDTYGGKAYRGSAKLEAKRRGKWSMEKEKAT